MTVRKMISKPAKGIIIHSPCMANAPAIPKEMTAKLATNILLSRHVIEQFGVTTKRESEFSDLASCCIFVNPGIDTICDSEHSITVNTYTLILAIIDVKFIAIVEGISYLFLVCLI